MIYYIGRYGVTYALAKTIQSARSIAYDLAKMNLGNEIFVCDTAFEKMDSSIREMLEHSSGYASCNDESRKFVMWAKYKNGSVNGAYRLCADGTLGKKMW